VHRLWFQWAWGSKLSSDLIKFNHNLINLN
jgi:hypothetical protein